jgi:hypothetical protein
MEATKPALKSWRVNIPEETQEEWKALCERKKISQTDAATQLVLWFLRQDDVAQSIMFGQLEGSITLVDFLALEAKKKKPKPPVAGEFEVLDDEQTRQRAEADAKTARDRTESRRRGSQRGRQGAK